MESSHPVFGSKGRLPNCYEALKLLSDSPHMLFSIDDIAKAGEMSESVSGYVIKILYAACLVDRGRTSQVSTGIKVKIRNDWRANFDRVASAEREHDFVE